MKYTLIDYWLNFEEATIENRYSAGVRSVYYALLGEMNRRRYPKETVITVRGLQDLAGLRSVSTVHEALNVLKMRGLIDLRKEGGKTYVSLCEPSTRPNIDRTSGERLPNTRRTTSGGINMRASEDLQEDRSETEREVAREEGKTYGKDGHEPSEAVDWHRYIG